MNAEPDSTQSRSTSPDTDAGEIHVARAGSGHALGVIVLAAGAGTRMRSSLPKVLQPVCGVPMVVHTLNAAAALAPAEIAVVVGHGAELVREALAERDVTFVEQTELLGTGDAVKRARETMAGCGAVLVLNGDEPLITAATLRQLLARLPGSRMAFTAQRVDDIESRGRVVRDEAGQVRAIVQAADEQRVERAGELNWGEYAFEAEWLWERIERVPVTPKGEYYLTHLVEQAYGEGCPAATFEVPAEEGLGVDDKVKLAAAEAVMRRRILTEHMLAGVTIVDPASTYIDAGVEIGADVTVMPNCYLYGATGVESGSTIGPGTTLRNAAIGKDTRVEASVIEDSRIGERCSVGPFSHVRGNAVIGDECKLGNYAEVKNSVIGRGCDMHHFSYVGDATVGEETNIAAGVITCNFDGVNKNRTVLGSRVLLGSDTMLVAPVSVGDGAITGAGSVVTKDIPAGEKWAGVPARPLGVATLPEAKAEPKSKSRKKPKR
ncbi:MAG: bifunctional UDP-N-acetylglucosamine diphosphorylase/glucosamine-1-phosphate N-acetyltransferase GlmU [Tepidiformaceae bacterium]